MTERFQAMLDLFEGDFGLSPRLAVLRASFAFPLPQGEA